jgi:sigma-B regulation protein RsbU (phosphoserine phosphatase)
MVERILIVDDHEENRDLMAGILEEAGYATEQAAEGQEALRRAVNIRPDLILLDVRMPGLSGYEVCQILQLDPRIQDIPVIFLSAMGGQQDKIRGLEIGGVDYITKPFHRQEVLARVAVQLKVRRLTKEILDANRSLKEKQRRLDEDLRAAAGIQRSLLPQKLPVSEELAMAWKFLPSEVIGGDIFNVLRLDDSTLALYMIDVSGHGAPAALVTVSVAQALQPHTDGPLKRRTGRPPYYQIRGPRKVLEFLEREYPLERFGMSFTILYALVDASTGRMTYSSAGHPPPVLLHGDGGLELLEKGGPMIGLQSGLPFAEGRMTLAPGDVLLLYTDGVLEMQNLDGAMYGLERLCGLLRGLAGQPVGAILDGVVGDLRAFGGNALLRDDVSLLGLEYRGKER